MILFENSGKKSFLHSKNKKHRSSKPEAVNFKHAVNKKSNIPIIVISVRSHLYLHQQTLTCSKPTKFASLLMSSSYRAVSPTPALGVNRSVKRGHSRLVLSMRLGAGGGVPVGPILRKLQSDCATPFPVLRHVVDAMGDEMRAGLAADGDGGLPMILSYVDSLPTGLVSNFGIGCQFSLSLGFCACVYVCRKRFQL